MTTPVEIARRIAEQVAGPAADDVDVKGRFPTETLTALADEGMLGALIPLELGGLGADLGQVCAAITELAKHCASSAMIFAMHQIQVACLLKHGAGPYFREFIRRVATEQLLLASATTEIGIGGDVRTSTCAVIRRGQDFQLDKQAPVISYGEYADAILVTARATPESTGNDQVLVLALKAGLTLQETSGWDTLGFRGTCSSGFALHVEGESSQIFSVPYSEISAATMLPVSHLVWSSLWLGIATAALAKARRFVQTEARKKPGLTPPGALRLAELAVTQQQLASSVRLLITEYTGSEGDWLTGDERVMSMAFALEMNSLKVSASTLVVDIVQRAMLICGIAGYKLDSPYSMSRLLRDAIGGALMVNNDRILTNNAQLMLAIKDY